MAEDITNTTLPNDNTNTPDEYFSDTNNYGEQSPFDDSTVQPTQGISESDSDGVKVDSEILSSLYPDPQKDEFVFGRNIESGFTGVNSKSLNMVVGQMTLPISPTITSSDQNMAGMYGSRWLGNSYGAKVINIPITILADNESEYRDNIEAISNVLIQLTNQEIPIIFGQWADRTYFGHFSSIPDPAYMAQGDWNASLTLQFTCSDPHGYLEQEYGGVDTNNHLTLSPKGNDNAKPLYHFEFQEDSNNFGYVNSEGEKVFVGFVDDDNPTDLLRLVYREPMEDLATFTHVTDMSTQNWALANAKATTDGTLSSTGSAIQNGTFWETPQDYTGSDTAFGNVLLTSKFNVGDAGNYLLSNRLRHSRYYDRAYQRLETYLIDASGNKIGRFGMKDYGSGGLTYVYILFGKTVVEEDANLANGFGYYGTGNTVYANSQLVDGKGIMVNVPDSEEVTLTLDREVEVDTDQVFYSGNFNPNSTAIQHGTKSVRHMVTYEHWRTPRDANGKAIGPQQYTKETPVNTLISYTTDLNKVVNHKSQKITYTSTRDVHKKYRIWGSAVGLSEWYWNWHDEWGYNSKEGHNDWINKSADKGTWVDTNYKRINSTGTITNTSREVDHNDRSALTSFWGNFSIQKINNQLQFKVAQIDWSTGLETNNIVVDMTFNIPEKFNAKIAQIAFFMGKTPIHEDKITKTTTAEDGTKTYQYVKSYTDDNLTVTDLTIKGITTADDLKQAHTIIHAGDTADIDTETENIYINGQMANQYLSPSSTFPLLKGGKMESIDFQPTGNKARVSYVYRPAMK